VPSDVVAGMGALYELGLSYNDFSGPIPTIPNTSTGFRHLYLDHNDFSGQFEEQLKGWTQNLDSSTTSRLYMDHNDLSGPLPTYLYDLIYDAHGINSLAINENHFLCDQQRENGRRGADWPAWVLRVGTESFGVCTPLAMVTSATVPNPGSIVVTGANFLASTQLKCKLINLVTSVATIVNAAYRSPTEVECIAPTIAPTMTYAVQVANYGTDFYSPALAGSAYVMRSVVIPANEVLSVGVIIAIVVSVVVAFLLCLCALTLIQRERAGKPVFSLVGGDVGSAKPLATATKSSSAAGGHTL